jgi:tripartite-type tricarboxylate transporter receptor subunit TctC
MKRFIFMAGLVAIISVLGIATSTIHAQTYPNRPIQLIVPMAPGAACDTTGRLLAEELGKILGQPVIVANKVGASTTLATDFVAKGKKDGYTLLYGITSGIVYAKVTTPEIVPYDPFTDLEPLGLHVVLPLAIGVQENSPFKTFGELVDYAKKNPGKLRASTHGVGTIDYFDLEIVQSLTGAQFTHVPFKGGATIPLLGGHVEVTFDPFSLIAPHVYSGKLKLLLVTKKMPQLPNIPTFTEVGYKQELPSAWFALYGPAHLPEEVKKVLVPAIEKAVKNPELKARIEKLGIIIDYKSPEELRKLMKDDYGAANDIAVKMGLRK